MGYLSDITDIARQVSTVKQSYNDVFNHKSVARGALDGTLQFPCLVSDAIPIDMAATIARTLERVYASFVQSYLSLNNTIDISIDKNPEMFLKRFHHNIKVESFFDNLLGTSNIDIYNESCGINDAEYEDMMKRIYDGSTKAFINENENQILVFNFSDKFDKNVYESNKDQLVESMKYFDFNPFPRVGNSPFYEAIDQDSVDTSIATAMLRRNIDKQNKIDEQKTKIIYSDKINVPQMTDNDVKKSNDMQPYMMQVRLMAVNDQNEFVQFMDFIVGIKVVLHNIHSDEMILNLQNALQNTGKLFNFIRWTTGEKSLIKDLLLNINNTKLDVSNRSRGASHWWLTLKRLRETARAQKAMLSRNQIVPNSTIVISSYDADIITKNYGMNLRNPKYAEKLMKSLFLMNFVIVDDGTRTVDILYDGERSFQTYALETLEREVSMNSNKIGKELTRMISR